MENRARAGFLAANSVRILDQHGLSAGLRRAGQYHDTCAFRGDHGQFELKYSDLGRGEVHGGPFYESFGSLLTHHPLPLGLSLLRARRG